MFFLFFFPLSPGVWLPQHVHMGGQRLVRLQGDPLALQEVLLSAWTWETAGPCAHLDTVSTKTRRQTLTDTDTRRRREEKRREEKCLFLGGTMCAHLNATLVGTLRFQKEAERDGRSSLESVRLSPLQTRRITLHSKCHFPSPRSAVAHFCQTQNSDEQRSQTLKCLPAGELRTS